MGLNLHDPDYIEMHMDFEVAISDWMTEYWDDCADVKKLVSQLFSIMNDYGAVSWT